MKRLLLYLSFILLPTLASSQTWRYVRNEVSFGVGASNFLGDLGGAKGIGTHGIKDLKLAMTRPSIQLGYKYMITPGFSVKGTFIWGYLNGDDANTKNVIRNNRNLSFRSVIGELSVLGEFYPWGERVTPKYKIVGVNGNKTFTVMPYFYTGIGVTFFNPKAELNGSWVPLQPLGTEGQGLAGRPDKYKRVTMIFPFGMGLKYLIDKHWSLSFDISLRYTLSDYIDDVSTTYYFPDQIQAANGGDAGVLSDRAIDPSLGLSGVNAYGNGVNNYLQRGNPKYNDAYMFAIFSVHYRFKQGTSFIPKF